MDATVSEAPGATQKPAAQPTIGGSVYVKPQDIAWEPTQFDGISIKVLAANHLRVDQVRVAKAAAK